MSLLKYIVLIVILFVAGCGTENKKYISRIPESVNVVERAERFTLRQIKDITEVKIIDPWQGATGINQIYNLVKRGTPLPAGIDSSEVIFVPLHKIICMSTTYLAMISALDEEKSISGVSGTSFVYSPEVIRNIEKGLVVDVGYEANLNKELILKISPDLVMIYGIGGESSGYLGKLKELGIKVIINADYLETDPLARAEWVKLFGALYCKEIMADSIYKNEVEEYNRLKSFILKNSLSRPKVLLGLPFKDTWYISPGNSYVSNLISDAGGDYLWMDTKSSYSMPFGIENVYIRGLKADYWLNTGNVNSKKEISNIDPRLDALPCYKNGNLFNNNKRITTNGGNDYWERGTLFPHLILKDIASILHPELFTGQNLMFYKKIK
jgi:iron complex transport system substrate-binding protein